MIGKSIIESMTGFTLNLTEDQMPSEVIEYGKILLPDILG